MKKFCNVTFVEEGQPHPDGGTWKLLRCSRCQGCFYRGRAEQKAHWKVHKKVCQPAPLASPFADNQRFDEMNMDEAAAELSMLFQHCLHEHFIAGPVWVLLMQRIYHLFLTTKYRNKIFNIGFQGNLVMAALQLLPSLPDKDMELLWAIPGMASFLLSSIDLTSNHMRQKREGKTALSAKELMSYQCNPATHVDFGLASFFGVWMMASVQRGSVGGVGFTGGWRYRNTGFARAAAHRLALWWKDPYTRASLSLLKDHHASNRQEWMPLAIMTAIDQIPVDGAHPSEIAPGLTLKDAAETIAKECYVYTPLRFREMVNCLLESYGFEQEVWEHFSAEDRAECALIVVERLIVTKMPEAGEGWCFRASLNLGAELVLALTGLDTRGNKVKDPSLRLKVLKLASRNRSKRGTVKRSRDLHPPDYFGLCLDKIIEAHRPQMTAVAEVAKSLDSSLPDALLQYIAEFICEPFSDDAREGVELTYLTGFVDLGS